MIGRVVNLPIDIDNGLVDGSILNPGKYFVKIQVSESIIVKE